ncbi:gliding motility-associated ABC transporter ATP-binding subunit GldA [Capnocytophaga sp. ARDL2]|uniref:gliding motility-associated ABC transporter ATP-binding subunit GldA n=1 Tax=Capnocytophaga sp. ARDL2 TaxID=3238809 RepID=UPI0035564AB9
MSIQVKNISKVYGEQRALNNVSFDINKNEIVGFLGPNGAGKSTLMKIMTSYISATDGEVFINGKKVGTEDLSINKSIGYLPEHNPLYTELYVREYLEFNANIYQVSKNRIEEVIKITGLTPEAHKKIGSLSKGYRQRVGIACALLHNPDILILDEPTTGLDPNQLIEIRQLIKNIAKDKIVFLSTHIMQEVEAMCNRVIIIKKGEIVSNYSLTELLQNEENQTVEVVFDVKIEEQFLGKLPHLIQLKNVHGNEWELVFSTKDDMRSKLFDFAIELDVKILSMNLKNKKLEEIFREKTS